MRQDEHRHFSIALHSRDPRFRPSSSSSPCHAGCCCCRHSPSFQLSFLPVPLMAPATGAGCHPVSWNTGKPSSQMSLRSVPSSAFLLLAGFSSPVHLYLLLCVLQLQEFLISRWSWYTWNWRCSSSEVLRVRKSPLGEATGEAGADLRAQPPSSQLDPRPGDGPAGALQHCTAQAESW